MCLRMIVRIKWMFNWVWDEAVVYAIDEIEVILKEKEKFEKKLLNELIWFDCMVEWDDWMFDYVGLVMGWIV